MGVRDDLAAAASTVAGVHVTPYYRQTTKVGDGWVALERFEADSSGLGFMDSWAVSVVLSQDIRAAEEWIDAHADALAVALAPELLVTTVIPERLVLDTGTVPGLTILGKRAR